MKIIIGADLVPTDSNYNEFIQGNTEKLFDRGIEDILKKADFRIFNLEVPLTDKWDPIQKCGSNLIAPTATISGIKKTGVNLVTIANNHIMDQGEQGLYSTIKVLENAGISYVGAGKNLKEASKAYIIKQENFSVGVYACAEHEFSIATDKKSGANPFDCLDSIDHIEELKKNSDFVIVLYHGGKEHYRYPSPNLRKICRKICDKGADLVVCQHSHCIGCEEKQNDGVIVYGQGNFLFDHSESEFWKTSLLISVDTDKKEIEYIPVCKNGIGVRSASEDEKKTIIKDFKERSENIKKEGFVEIEYEKYALKARDIYLSKICGKEIIFRAMNKLFRYKLRYKISRKKELAIRNFVECEAHRELFLRGISNE